MRRKFKLKVCYTFNGCFTLRAASGKEAARLVSEQCGTVLNTIRTTLGEESEVDWLFDKHRSSGDPRRGEAAARAGLSPRAACLPERSRL